MKGNRSREGKGRINVWLEKRTLENLRAQARTRRVSLQALIESAIAGAFGPELRERRDELILRRLNMLGRQVHVVERLVEVATEAFATFLRIYLGTTPDVPSGQFEAVRRRCQDKFQSYLKTLAKNLVEGPCFFEELPEGAVFRTGSEDQRKKPETFSNSDRTVTDSTGGRSNENKQKS